MVRKLALVMALTAAGLPNWAAALGLGDIDLNSNLNQPLQAEIPLRATNQEELDSLRVTLASPADFARAGIDFQHSLRQLKFDVVRDGDRPVIKVTSSGDFREPYVSFLLEVNWSRGRIMREYTLLVDPPVIAGEGGTAISAPQARAQAPQSSTQAQAQPSERRSVASEPRGLPATSRGADTYGPTQRADTLWTIASEVRPDQSVSVEQTMLALQRLNPDAFIGDNVNQLKAGYVLKVPNREQIENMTRAQARAEFRRQTQVWRSGDTPAEPTSTAQADTTAGPQGRLQLLAPDAAEGGEAADAAQQAGEAAAGSGEPVAGAAGGTSEGTSEQDEALRNRVTQLQQQVQDLERLAELKDDQLAALQAQLKALREQTGEPGELPELPGEAVEMADTAAEVPAETAAEEPLPESESTAAQAPAEAGRFGEPVEATRASPVQDSNPYVVEGYKPVDLGSLPSDTATTAPSAQQEAAPAPAEAAGEQPMTVGQQIAGWWQKTVALFRDNPLYMGIAVAALIVLLLALLLVRQRRRAAAGFGESILQPAPEPHTDRTMAAAAAAGAVAAAAAEERDEAQQAQEPDSSYLSDFSISSMDSAIESEVSEADPLTEADVFLAYGRYQPAENMIREAIDNEPDRLDLKIKLLEIYYAARNGEAFEREAQAVHGLVEDHSDPAWQKVAEMGRDLRPDSPLFTDAGEPVIDEDEDLGLADTDFDLQEDQAARPSAGDNMIDFDLGELEQAGQPGAAAAPFDTAMDESAERSDASDQLGGDLADELSALAGDLETDQQPQNAPESEVAEFDLSDLNLEPEAEQDYLADMEPEAEDEDAGVVDGGVLSDGDEVGTKLDLARAYIDMGDPDGARSILDEVLEEGSEDQKNEAQGLMTHIS